MLLRPLPTSAHVSLAGPLTEPEAFSAPSSELAMAQSCLDLKQQPPCLASVANGLVCHLGCKAMVAFDRRGAACQVRNLPLGCQRIKGVLDFLSHAASALAASHAVRSPARIRVQRRPMRTSLGNVGSVDALR